MNQSFLFYASFYKAINRIKDPAVKLAAYEAITAYAIEGTLPDDDAPDVAWMVFEMARPNIDANIKNKTNGSKGGRGSKTENKPPVLNKKTTGLENEKPPVSNSENHRLENSASNKELELDKELDRELELDKEEDKEISSDEEILSSKTPTRTRINYKSIVNAFNDSCPSLPHVQKLTDGRREAIKARYQEHGFNTICDVFRKAEESDFLTGRNGRWNGCSFDWIMKPSNFVKILEGNYVNKVPVAGGPLNGPPDTTNPFLQMLNEWEGEDEP